MSEPMVVRYLMTRAQIDTGQNPLLSATADAAQTLGKDMSSHKQLKYVEELFTAMTVHHGSGRMLNKLKWASKPRFCTCCQAIDVNCPKTLSVAVALGDVQFVKSLIKTGADTDYESDLGAPPLVAMRRGNIQ
jgi:hypothetical protein